MNNATIFLFSVFIFACNKEIFDCNNEYPLNESYEKADFYVAMDGDDNNPGTYFKPWATWQKAFSSALAGDTVLIRGGTYYASTKDAYGVFISGKNGTYSNPISVFNYPGETPILNCSTLSTSSDNIGVAFIKSSYFHIKGLTVTRVIQQYDNASAKGYYFNECNGFTIENCVSHSNNGAGYCGISLDTIYFENCDSYDNYDILTNGYEGGQADGFVLSCESRKSHSTFISCRSWYNSDDGFDCWENEGVVVFNNCWAFNNGRDEGDGGGFKLGRTNEQPLNVSQRIVTNCLAFKNRYIGFNQNGANVIMTFYNNIAFENDATGYELSLFSNPIIIRNNISYGNNGIGFFSNSVIHDHNSWDAAVEITNEDFISIDSSGISGSRQSNGDLPVLNFLRLAIGSDLINAGINVGLPFTGSNPDIGPFEKE
jgi:hypothetical protein